MTTINLNTIPGAPTCPVCNKGAIRTPGPKAAALGAPPTCNHCGAEWPEAVPVPIAEALALVATTMAPIPGAPVRPVRGVEGIDYEGVALDAHRRLLAYRATLVWLADHTLGSAWRGSRDPKAAELRRRLLAFEAVLP